MDMPNERSYTIEEVSQLLKVSKLTVYDLVKKEELPVFRVGRQMRVDAKDLDDYIKKHKTNQHTRPSPTTGLQQNETEASHSQSIVISGQDMVLDILATQIENHSSYKTLRSFTGSLNSLFSLYNGQCDIVSLHMFDGDSGQYNLPYVKKVLVSDSYLLMNLVLRKAGMYVQKGNPLHITSWKDLKRKSIKMINREKGSGARTLLDEQLRIHHISPKDIEGYERVEMNHLSVASSVASGQADVGVGIEKVAKIVGVDFIPLITERYDLVMLKNPQNDSLIKVVTSILTSASFKQKIHSLGDYDVSEMGSIIYETY
jgi:putative molybdopterin biosynthesis protein